jgi:ADP-heptose:LPS heptosyltransferase
MARSGIKLKLTAVVRTIRNAAKLVVKNISPVLGSLLLAAGGVAVDRTGYEKRILVVFGGGIGDVVKRSIVCEYVKEYLSTYDVYYLMPYEISFPYAKETIHFNYTKAKIDPLYYFRLVNKLRKVGFSRVIVLFPAWEGFLVSLGKNVLPDTLYRHIEVPPKELLGFASGVVNVFRMRHRNFHDIPVVSYYDKRWTEKYFPSDVHKVAYFFSQAICNIEPENVKNLNEKGLLKDDNLRTEIEFIEEDTGLAGPGGYCVIGLGSSSIGKNWPPEKFGQVAEFLRQKGIKMVLVGGPESIKLTEAFKKTYTGEFIDLINKTNLNRLCNVIDGSRLVVGNDTSFVHLAVALKKPTICICYGMQIGADSCYGYKDINHWIFSENFDKIGAPEVNGKIDEVLSYLDRTVSAPKERFVMSFFEKQS